MLASALAATALAALFASAEPAAAPSGAERGDGSPWQALEPGLEYALFDGPPADAGDRKIAVVRIDPARFDLRLANASAPGEGEIRTARAWAYRTGASAAINASMYQEDYRSSVSLMRTRDHVNQRRLSKDKAVLAFDPLVSGVAPVRIVDRECDDFSQAEKRYGSLVQSIRMISCERRNVWAPSDRRFSSAAIGLDSKGRVLFIHARSPWTVHDLVKALLALPIDIARAMYVEGGPEAQLFARSGAKEIERVGGFEGAARAAENPRAWPVPNVIVAVRRR
ncbi:MAG TPA: phosphodiester glycosidase family protein [Anaeromyxobacter sp.]